jgi:hypothetical protein
MAVRIRSVLHWSHGYLAPLVSGELYASIDGRTWNVVRGGPSGPTMQIVDHGGRLIALAGASAGPCELGGTCLLPLGDSVDVWQSDDGTTWTRLGTAAGLGPVEGLGLASLPTGPLVAIVCARYDPRIFPPQSGCVPATSEDGVAWKRAPALADGWVPFRIVAALDKFEIVGGYGSPTRAGAWWSADGRSWQAATVAGSASGTPGVMSRLLAGRGGLMADGDNGRGASNWWRSRDGVTWEVNYYHNPAGETPPADAMPCPNGFVESDGDRFVAGAPGGKGWTSLDGYEWTPFQAADWADLQSWNPRSRYGCGGEPTIVVLPGGVATPREYGAGS